MIEIIESKSGYKVLKAHGKLLCSKFEPVKEAKVWVTQNSSMIESVPSVIVLGLGAGYHVAELCNSYPTKSILVIEPNQEIIDFNMEKHSMNLARVRILSCKTIDELLNQGNFKKSIRNLYCVVSHIGAIQSDLKYFEKIKNILLGRSLEELSQLLKFRPHINSLLNNRSKMKSLSDELINIKTINNWLTGPIEGHEKDYMAFRALKELVS